METGEETVECGDWSVDWRVDVPWVIKKDIRMGP